MSVLMNVIKFFIAFLIYTKLRNTSDEVVGRSVAIVA